MEQAEVNSRFSYSIWRLIMMGSLSIILYMSIFMSVLTPYPVALVFVLFGRHKGFIVAGLTTAVFYILVQQGSKDIFLIGIFIFAMLVALGLSEVIYRKITPVKGILVMGMSFIVLGSAGLFSYQQSSGVKIREIVLGNIEKLKPMFDQQINEIRKSNSENALELEAYLKQPQVMTDDIMKQGPSAIIMSVFVVLWANMFLLLKSNRILNQKADTSYSEKILIQFRVPEQLIIGVIIGLIMAMWGDVLGEWGPTMGITLLKVLGVFYFFQGFGIYVDFLDHVRIFGFLRSILVVLTVLTAHEMLALIGLFDMFVNFRKFLKKKDHI